MIYGCSHIGLVRATNEDSLFYDENIGLMIIADGIGGHSLGEEASSIAVETLKDYICFKSSIYSNKLNLLSDGFVAANQAVHKLQADLPDGQICGTTLSCAFAYQGVLYFAHVGDSRIYVSRDKKDIEQITHDHTYLSELAKRDHKTFVELQDHKLMRVNNYLTRAIGPDSTVEPQLGKFSLKNNDHIILMTDGVYRYIKPMEILQFLNNNDNLSLNISQMMDRVLELGGKDNLSVIVGVFGEGGPANG